MAPKKSASKKKEQPVADEAQEHEIAEETTVAAAPAAVNEEGSASAADLLMTGLIGSGGLVASLVESVLGIYRGTEPDKALCAVLNCVCKAAGVPEVEIESSTVHQEGNIVATLEEMFARVPQDSAAYLLVNKDPNYKRFRKNFPEFFEQLATSAYNSGVLLDNIFIGTILQWLIAMTESKARAFRHTSTVAILGLIQGVNDRIVYVKDSIQTLKKKDAVAAQKVLDHLLQLQDHMFTSAVHTRIKDIAPEIRLVVMQSLKHWCAFAPDIYVTNKYLRYFSIALYDKRPELRMEGLEAIVHIVGYDTSSATKMRDFLRYFAERLVEMVNDTDSKCADLAVKVAAVIVRSDTLSGETEETAIFSNSMIDRVLLSLFDERQGIRSSAGTFLKVFIRCRVGDAEGTEDNDNEQEANRMRIELLCTFASIFRSTYNLAQPEKYLVDALWKNDNPPSVLTEFQVLRQLAAESDDSENVVVALKLLAALLCRLRDNTLSFGPSAKDDFKLPAASTSQAKEVIDQLQALRVKLSKSLVLVLADILTKHERCAPVILAVANVLAAMDLHVFTTQKESSKAVEAFAAFRKAIVAGSALVATAGAAPQVLIEDRVSIGAVTEAWHAIAFTEYPQQDEAKKQFNEFVKTTLSLLQTKERSKSRSSQDLSQMSAKDSAEYLGIWGSLAVISALMPLKDQTVLLQNTFKRAVNACQAPSHLTAMASVSFHILLWQYAEIEADPSLSPDSIREDVAEVLALLLDVAQWHTEENRDEPGVLEARCDCLCFAADVACLPSGDLTQHQQEAFVELATELFDAVNEQVKLRTADIKQSLKSVDANEASTIAPVVAAKRRVIAWESTLTRLATSVVRLLSFRKLQEPKLAPRMLLLWTRSNVKVVADVFKSLFHTLRDRSPDGFAFEKDILLAAYKQCAEQASTAPAVEALYQLGSKLASMHFHPLDKHYPTLLQIVRFGIEFATTVDPTILNAISPFCSRLKQSDALAIANSLQQHELFVDRTSAYAAAFVSAVRRAAKLEDSVGSAPPSSTPWRSSKKRPRELTGVSASAEQDPLMAEVAASVPRPRPAQTKTAKTPNARAGRSPAVRIVTEDGWRGRPEDEAIAPSQASSRGGAAQRSPPMPGTQESAALSTMLAELEDEVFVATQEFD